MARKSTRKSAPKKSARKPARKSSAHKSVRASARKSAPKKSARTSAWKPSSRKAPTARKPVGVPAREISVLALKARRGDRIHWSGFTKAQIKSICAAAKREGKDDLCEKAKAALARRS